MKEIGRQRKNLKQDLKRVKYKRILGSFSEGQGFADKRKRKTLNRYHKHKRKSPRHKDTFSQTEEDDTAVDTPESFQLSQEGVNNASTERKTKMKKLPTKRSVGSDSHRYSKAQKEYQERLSKKQQKAQALQEEKMKQEKALEDYRKQKSQRNKLFSQKTKRGQPIMKHQIDFLLEKLKAEGD